MATTNGNRKILDTKRWEYMNPSPVTTAAGTLVVNSRHVKPQALYVNSATVAYLYAAQEDGYTQVPSPALATAIAAGACGTAHTWSTGATVGAASLTATGGTTSTIITNQTLARDLRGYSVHILSGPNAGSTLTISSNTIGATATITVPTQGSAFTASTVYRIIAPRFYVLAPGTLASGSFKVYDFPTNTWTTLANTGLPATIGTDAVLTATPSWLDTTYLQFATGSATSATATTLVNSAKKWNTSQWRAASVGNLRAGKVVRFSR